jgi:hypothetical protein
MAYRIPLNRPLFAGHERDSRADALANGEDSFPRPFARWCGAFWKQRLPCEAAWRLPPTTSFLDLDHAHSVSIGARHRATRDALIDQLTTRGIQTELQNVPLQASPMGREHGRLASPFSVNRQVTSRQLRPPLDRHPPESQPSEMLALVRSFHDACAKVPEGDARTMSWGGWA